eukprot:2099564-Rhodomonas_salina.1
MREGGPVVGGCLSAYEAPGSNMVHIAICLRGCDEMSGTGIVRRALTWHRVLAVYATAMVRL